MAHLITQLAAHSRPGSPLVRHRSVHARWPVPVWLSNPGNRLIVKIMTDANVDVGTDAKAGYVGMTWLRLVAPFC